MGNCAGKPKADETSLKARQAATAAAKDAAAEAAAGAEAVDASGVVLSMDGTSGQAASGAAATAKQTSADGTAHLVFLNKSGPKDGTAPYQATISPEELALQQQAKAAAERVISGGARMTDEEFAAFVAQGGYNHPAPAAPPAENRGAWRAAGNKAVGKPTGPSTHNRETASFKAKKADPAHLPYDNINKDAALHNGRPLSPPGKGVRYSTCGQIPKKPVVRRK